MVRPSSVTAEEPSALAPTSVLAEVPTATAAKDLNSSTDDLQFDVERQVDREEVHSPQDDCRDPNDSLNCKQPLKDPLQLRSSPHFSVASLGS